MRIFSLKSQPTGRSAQERSLFYSEVVNEAFQRFYSEEQTPPSVLVHITCTGYVSPSGAQRLVSTKTWGESTEVIHAYHMGCYAALPAVRLAKSFLSAGKASVDLVHTELCSLHLDPTQHSVEQLTMQTLFADGLIRYSASSVAPKGENSFEVLATKEEIIPNSENEMTWMASDHGMRMTLSRKIPDRIAEVLDGFLSRLVGPTGMSTDELKNKAIFAVHPGGPRIIDHVKDLLGLRDEQVAASNRILRDYGNMSSATLPHIWQSILEDESVPANTPVVSLAFGPGLTISSAILVKRLGQA
jgi:predicted naringenin-chalcone synthase